MIPIKLQLRNFLCYRDNVSPLSFEDFHVVCLSGDNGNGKSALLDAITWALWGKARVDDRELIYFGRTEMEVEFEFGLGHERYRVIRKRSLKYGGKAIRTILALDFQVSDDGRYRSIAGNSTEDTQRRIVETLRMDYQTFVNSAFLRQGRADEFTAKQPSHRKEVLAEILDLGYYDELSERAKQAGKACQDRLRELAASVREIDSVLAQKSEYERQLAAIQEEMKSLENSVLSREIEVTSLRSRKAELDIKEHQFADIKRKMAEAQREIEEMQTQIQRHRQRIGDFEEVIARTVEIEDGYASLAAARSTNESFNEKVGQLVGLKDRENALARTIAEVKNALVTEQKVIRSNVENLEKRAIEASSLEKQLASLRGQLDGLLDLDARRDERREFVQSCRSQIELLKAMNVQLRQDMESIKEKLELLVKAGAACPLCESDLGPSGRDRLSDKFRSEGQQMGITYRENDRQSKRMEQDAQAALTEITQIEQSIREREALQRQVAMVEKGLADAREAEQGLRGAREQLERVAAKVERGEYAQPEQKELIDIQARMLALGYDEEQHQRAKSEIARLQEYDEAKVRLDAARERFGEEQQAMERTETILARWQVGLAQDVAQRDALAVDLQALPELERRIIAVERELDGLLAQQASVRMRLGQAQQMLNHCRYLEGQRAEKVAAQSKSAEEEAIYKELAVAFGKNGVQALIIDSAIPEIEHEANALLARMTDGRLHVTLETQKEVQAGGIRETLEIRVGDELGLRSYDTYSGGEAFRINFAIRVALSKLLARRAGARLQTLVVDEGFGTLDVSGRDSLVEAINSVSDDFAMIIVVTHIQELKDAFPARIDVVKDVDGAQVIVN